tara:strand:+ start:5852 stop:7423 length:1572 start_codon:yes stop_codon:yes gene_type:complete
MAKGSYVLAVDWNNDGDFSDSGEDITARTMNIEFTRGNDYASQLVGKGVAGVLNAVINNESGDYSTFNASGGLYGNLVPGRTVKLTGNDGSTTRTLWTGFIDSIEPVPSVNGANLAKLKAIGPLGYLNKFEVSTALFANLYTGALIGKILDAAGWDADDRDIDTGIIALPRFWVQRTKTLQALRLIEDTETGHLEESATGNIVYRDRHARSKDTASTVSQATYSDASGAALSYSQVQQIDPLKFIYNELAAKITPLSGSWILGTSALDKDTQMGVDAEVLWTYPETGPSSPTISAGATRTFVAQYPNSGSGTTSSAVDFWTDLTATTDYLANDSSDGSGANRTANMSISLTKRAQSMDITITNGHSGTVYITKLQAQGHKITTKDNFEISATDSTSQTAYGRRTYPHPGKFIPDSEEAQNWADFHVSAWKDPVPLLRITLVGNRSSATLTDIMSRNISDLVTVTASNDAGLGISEGFFVENLHHSIDAQLNHRATYTLSQSAGYAGFFLIGSSSLDNSTRLAY